MLITFSKMHSLGNDFIVLDLISQGIKLHALHIKKIANRHLGLGCDQVILIEPPRSPDADFYFRAFNADGNEVEQCGNGLRCAARHVFNSKLVNKHDLVANGLAGKTRIKIKGKHFVSVDLGEIQSPIETHQVNIQDLPQEIHALSLGNPHGICIVEDLSKIPLETWGKQLCSLPCFPNQANISFVQLLAEDEIKVRVYERGVGPTLACGSGACAAAIICHQLKKTIHRVKVHFEHGYLTVNLDENYRNINLFGPTTEVFTGKFYL